MRQVIGGADQFGWRIGLVRRHDAVLHVAVGGDDDEQDAFFREIEKLDLPNAAGLTAGGDDDAGKVRQAGEQLRGAGDDLVVRQAMQRFFHLAHLSGFERLHGEQAIDEQTVAARRRNAPGGRVRAGDEAGLFQVRHYVADGGRRQVKAGKLGQRTRADRLPVGNIVFDQGFQQGARAFIKHG